MEQKGEYPRETVSYAHVWADVNPNLVVPKTLKRWGVNRGTYLHHVFQVLNGQVISLQLGSQPLQSIFQVDCIPLFEFVSLRR
jgi:hypothetical protein